METSISFDQRRRELRRELFIQRLFDRDNSVARLFADARKLDADLESQGFKLLYKTDWGSKLTADNPPTHLKDSKTDFNCAEVLHD